MATSVFWLAIEGAVDNAHVYRKTVTNESEKASWKNMHDSHVR